MVVVVKRGIACVCFLVWYKWWKESLYVAIWYGGESMYVCEVMAYIYDGIWGALPCCKLHWYRSTTGIRVKLQLYFHSERGGGKDFSKKAKGDFHKGKGRAKVVVVEKRKLLRQFFSGLSSTMPTTTTRSILSSAFSFSVSDGLVSKGMRCTFSPSLLPTVPWISRQTIKRVREKERK